MDEPEKSWLESGKALLESEDYRKAVREMGRSEMKTYTLEEAAEVLSLYIKERTAIREVTERIEKAWYLSCRVNLPLDSAIRDLIQLVEKMG